MSYFNKLQLIDEYGNDVEATMMNQIKVAETVRLAGGVFNDSTLDPNFGTSNSANGGTIAVANSELSLNVTASSGSLAEASTLSVARYMGASSNQYRSVIRLGDTGAVNNVRQWGAFIGTTAPIDGFFFELNGTTFNICHANNGSITRIPNGSFNGSGSSSGLSYTIDTNYHTYEIYYTNRRVLFVIDSIPMQALTATTAQLSSTLHLKPNAINNNTGAGSAVSLFALVTTISRLGKETSQRKSKYISGASTTVLKYGIGALHSLSVTNIANASSVTIYDNTAGSGTILWSSGSHVIQAQSNNLPYFIELGGAQFITGLTIVIAGTCNAFITYE